MRYPAKRTKYCKTVGKTRVENVARILRNLGFVVITLEPERHDVDVWVFKRDNETCWRQESVLVIEVTNWARNIYMDFRRVKRIIENFNNPRYHNSGKLLVFSFKKNIENQMNFFEGLDIDFLEMGFQTQPLRYYVFYRNQGQASGMRPNNRATKNLVKKKLEAYLTEKDLI